MVGTSSCFLSVQISLVLLLMIGSATCDDYYDITTINAAHEPSEGIVSDLNSNGTIDANVQLHRSTSVGDLDPFQGLYVGEYGSHGKEIVQLNRKYDNWDAYVEAVKITGDADVPAGQVTFRAKLGRKTSWPCPKGSEALASYIGQGLVAETGFKNPFWVDGVLFQLNGKLQGADLGFLFLIPGQSPYLVMYNRLT